MTNSIVDPKVGIFIRHVVGFTHEMTPVLFAEREGASWKTIPNDAELHVSEWERTLADGKKETYYRISLYMVKKGTPCSMRIAAFKMSNDMVFDELNGIRDEQ